jgi:hypothetical protein
VIVQRNVQSSMAKESPRGAKMGRTDVAENSANLEEGCSARVDTKSSLIRSI